MARFDPLKGEQKIVLSLSLFFENIMGLISLYTAIFAGLFLILLMSFLDAEMLQNLKLFTTHLVFKNWNIFDEKDLIFYAPEGVRVGFKLSEYGVLSEEIKASLRPVKGVLFACLIGSLFITFLLRLVYQKVAMVRVFGERNKVILRGGTKVSAKALEDQLRRKKLASDLRIGDVPLVKGTEYRHICMLGDTGVGKSQCILELLDQIRRRGEKVFIYDASGDFTKHFYREGIDNLLAPFDKRSVNWTPFSEGDSYGDMERVALSFSPLGSDDDKNKHWEDASNLILTSLLNEIKKNPDLENTNAGVLSAITMKIKRLIKDELGNDKIVKESLLDKLLKGTLAQMVINEDSPTHKSDVLSTLVPKIRSLQYMLGLENKRLFSIKDWVKNDKDKSWTIVRVNESELKQSQALITAWVDTLVSNVLSRDAAATETLWLVIDEAQGLGRIHSLLDAVEKGRKYHFACILGFTSHEKMKAIYGEKRVSALLSSLSTKLCFRYSDPDSAEWSSRLLGEQEAIEGRTSMGRHKDTGITEQEEKRRDPLVLRTEIQNQVNLHCYIKLPGDLPIAQMKKAYVEREVIAPYCVEREIPEPVVAPERVIDERKKPSDKKTLSKPVL